MKTLKGKILITLFIAVVGYGPVASALDDNDRPAAYRPAPTSTGPKRSDACFMSQKFVRQELKAPSTAEFPAWTEANCKVTQTGRIWKVRSFVDAQNSFGAMIRSDYGVEMVYYPATDTWTLLDIMIVSP